MAPEIGAATAALDGTLRQIMDKTCSWLEPDKSTSADQLRAAKERCSNTSSRLASEPSPYPDSYRYCGVQANAMYYHGGDGEWGNAVRGCLTCMDEMHVAPHDAHMFCYEEGTKRSGNFFGTLRGYAEAVHEALENVAAGLIERATDFASRSLAKFGDLISGKSE